MPPDPAPVPYGFSRKSRMTAIVAAGCSSISQWPELGTTAPVNVRRDEAEIVGHRGVERFLRADRHYRHRQLTSCREQLLVVDRVLRKGAKLLECVVHGPRPRIKGGVVMARRIVDRLRVGRQLIPEAVEIDALAAGDQALLVRAAKIEMP